MLTISYTDQVWDQVRDQVQDQVCYSLNNYTKSTHFSLHVSCTYR